MPPCDFDSGGIADRYDRGRDLPPATISLWLDEVARELPAGCRRLLDLGCGTGRFTAPLADRFSVPVVGVDVSRKMLAVAQRSLRRSADALAQASADALPFADASFDFVFLSMVLHHIAGSAAALAELARVIPQRGVLFIRTATVDTMDAYLWLRFFPEAAEVERRRLPDARSVERLLPGFALRSRRAVTQPFAADLREYTRKISERALSSLVAIPDDAFAAGMDRLRRYCETAAPGPVTERLEVLVFERRPAA